MYQQIICYLESEVVMDPFDYICEGQMTFNDFLREKHGRFKIDKPVRLIELFAGIGSQAMALRNIGANFEHYRVVEWEENAIKTYNAIHGTNFPSMDITKLKGGDLGITETESFTYIMTYSFPCQ